MTSISWQQQGMANLMGMAMSENKIESAGVNAQKTLDATSASTLEQGDTLNQSAMTENNSDEKVKPRVKSTLPAFDNEAEFVDDRDFSKTKKSQLQRILSTTWMRLVLVAFIFALVFFLVMFFRGLGEEKMFFNMGSSSSLQLNTSKTGRDNLTAEQAAYLMELQREDARKRARSGESSAAVIELPRASVEETRLADQTNVANIDSAEVVNHYEIERARQEGLRRALEARNSNKLNLANDSSRYKEVGTAATGSGYYIDQESNQIVVPPSTLPTPDQEEAELRAAQSQADEQLAAHRQRQAQQRQAVQSQQESQAIYNTQQGGGNNQYQQNNNYGGGQGGNQGGGQGNNVATDGGQEVNQRQPDPDLPVIQQRLYDDYERQLAEQEQYRMQLEQQRQENLERAQATESNRRNLAAQAFGEQVQRLEDGGRNTSGFSSQLYYQPEPEEQRVPDDYDRGVSTNPRDNGSFSPSSYTSNGYNSFGYTDPVAGGAYGGTSANKKNDEYSTPKPKPLPRNVLRAGTTWPVVVTKSVNTDEGLQVVAQVMGGPFEGSEVYGIVTPTGRDIGVNFTRIVPTNPRMPIIPLNAMALTIGSQKQAVSTKRNNHYLQNYSVMAAESIIEGYGDAYSNQNETTIERSDGSIITSKGETTSKEVRANILSQFADRLNSDIAKLGDRAPTYYVRQGTVLQMKLVSNMDMHQTTSDLAGMERTTL